jgi:hypothetical protein
MESEGKPRRLCSEIQLFDICAKDICSHKDGRYCSNGDILAKFEAIRDVEVERTPEQFMDEIEDTDDMEYDESFGDDEYGEEQDDVDEDW